MGAAQFGHLLGLLRRRVENVGKRLHDWSEVDACTPLNSLAGSPGTESHATTSASHRYCNADVLSCWNYQSMQTERSASLTV